MTNASSLTQLFDELKVDAHDLPFKEACKIQKRWLKSFASKVKKSNYEFGGFKWHGFSYGYQPSVCGDKAFENYYNQQSAFYYLFDEKLTHCWKCMSVNYPDLRSQNSDLYVTNEDMQWTMVFTHEQPELGPYFAISNS